MVDWDSFRQTYNRMHNTEYKTATEWITELYEKHNKYVSPVSEELGVGFGTMTRYLDKLGILERKPKGGARIFDRVRPKEELFLSISEESMRELSRDQICERCAMAYTTFSRLIKKYKRIYAKWKQT
jgi:hypothetical protein